MLITGEFIGLVRVITCPNSLLPARQRANTEGSAGFIDT